MRTQLLTTYFVLISSLLAVEEVDRIKWEDDKKHSEVLKGMLGDVRVAFASPADDDGMRELQFVDCPQTDEKITVLTTKNKDSKTFHHLVSVPRDFPFRVQIEAGEKQGSLVVTILDNGHPQVHELRKFSTDPEKNLIQVSL